MKRSILITGASGEMGHGMIKKLSGGKFKIIALDVNSVSESLKPHVDHFEKIDIRNKPKLAKLVESYDFDCVFHFAAILSTGAERDPEAAHEVNVQGTKNLMEAVNKRAESKGSKIKFVFPSSIAVYELPSVSEKKRYGKISEDQFLSPITIYGINKLYAEMLGIYYDSHYSLLSNKKGYIDFRCIRFPGIISADTVPTGGTSDYVPEMLHSAGQRKAYSCFVRPDTKIPFMTMPDAISALTKLMNVPKSKLTRHVYNIAGFTASAYDFEKIIKKKAAHTTNNEQTKNYTRMMLNSEASYKFATQMSARQKRTNRFFLWSTE